MAWQKKYPFVDFFLTPGQDMSLRDRLADLVEIDQFYRVEPPDAARIPRISEGITMHQGCNRNCTFCIVPSTRGRERSRTPDDILCEVQRLVERGTREVVLLSQIAERYGRDLKPRQSLADLLRQVLNDKAEGLERIRFLTSYPADFPMSLIDAIADAAEGGARTSTCRSSPATTRCSSGCSAATPTASTAIWSAACASASRTSACRRTSSWASPARPSRSSRTRWTAMAEIKWDVVHIAAYSTRPGTPAADYADQLPLEEKKRRVHEVEVLQKEIATARNAPAPRARHVEVLIEGESRGKWYGRTRTNKLVHIASEAPRQRVRSCRRKSRRRARGRCRAISSRPSPCRSRRRSPGPRRKSSWQPYLRANRYRDRHPQPRRRRGAGGRC